LAYFLYNKSDLFRINNSSRSFFHVPKEKFKQVSEEKSPIAIYGGKGCICSEWIKRGCGEGICEKDEKLEIRNCTPKGCQEEIRCVRDKECSFSIGEEVITNDLKWEVVKVKNRGNILKANESRYPILAEDKITEGKFIEVELIIKNIGRQSHYFSPPKIYDEKEREFDGVVEASEWIREDKICFSWDKIKPGFSKNCILIYEVAKDSTNL
jgi:hypothetical protein